MFIICHFHFEATSINLNLNCFIIAPEWMDIYVHVFGGYNLFFYGHADVNKAYIAEIGRFFGGAGFGVRSMIAERAVFFIDGRYRS